MSLRQSAGFFCIDSAAVAITANLHDIQWSFPYRQQGRNKQIETNVYFMIAYRLLKCVLGEVGFNLLPCYRDD